MKKLLPEERLARARSLGIVVDKQDEWLLSAFTWRVHAGHTESIITISPGKLTTVQLSHYIMGTPIYANECIDHIDRNPRNNRRNNLRLVDYTKNSLNSHKSDNATHIYLRENGTYQVIIHRYGVRHSVGTYKTTHEAKEARDRWLSQ